MKCSRFARLLSLLICLSAFNAGKPQVPFDLDVSFVTQIEETYVSSAAVLDDGKVLLSGRIRFPGDMTDRLLARVNPDGSQDLGFPFGYGGGRLTKWTDRFYVGVGQTVRRIWEDGTVDPDFIEPNLGPYFSALQGGDYHVFPDGRVLMSGYHTLSDSVRGFEGMYSLIWFSSEGYLDTTRIHRWADGSISDIEELPDGKFVCSGFISEYEGTPCSRVIRIHPDGALDTTFHVPPILWGKAEDFLPLPDGRIIIGGHFLFLGEPDTLNIVRVLPNGDLDPTFNMHLQPWRSFDPGEIDFIVSIDSIDPARYVVTGLFDRMDGAVRGGIALIDSTGQLSNDQFTGGGCGAFFSTFSGDTALGVAGITEAPDGSYFVYGAYHGYDDGTTNDTAQRMVSRLYGLDVGIPEVWPPATSGIMTVFPNPSQGPVAFAWEVPDGYSPQGAVLAHLVDAQGRLVLERAASRTGNVFSGTCELHLEITPGLYSLQLRDDQRLLAASKVVVLP